MKKTIASAVVTLLLGCGAADANTIEYLSLIHISEPTRPY